MTRVRWERWLWAAGVAAALGGAPATAEGQPGRKGALAVEESEEAKRLHAEVERLYGAGKYQEALSAAERLLAIRQRAFGAEHPRVAESLNEVALLSASTGDHARAETFYQRAISIREKTLGPEHPDTGVSVHGLALVYRDEGAYGRAEPLFLRALSITEKSLGPDHRATAAVLMSLAALHAKKGEYARAEPLYQRALGIFDKAAGEDGRGVSTALNEMAVLYDDMGAYDRAEPLFVRALSISEKAFGPTHPETAAALHNLASLYLDKGDYGRAEPLSLSALSIVEAALGPEHQHTASALNALALLYQEKGDYIRAEPLLVRALSIREKVLGPAHPDTTVSVNNLATLYLEKGDYVHAEPLFVRALSIREKVFGAEHPSTALSVSNLAALYDDQGDYVRAEPLFVRALSIRTKVLGPDHPDTAMSVSNLASLYLDAGDQDRAGPLFVRALSTREKVLGKAHPLVGMSLSKLALFYQARGEYARAEELHRRALSIFEKVFGPKHPDVAFTLDELGSVYLSRGDVERAVEYEARADEVFTYDMGLALATGSEAQKRAYVARHGGDVLKPVSIHARSAPASRTAMRLGLTAVLRHKGVVLDAMADGFAVLRRHLTAADQALFDRLASVESQLGVQTNRGPGKIPVEQHRKNLDALEAEREKLEADLSTRSAAFRAEQHPIAIADVQAAIPDGAALVEVLRYRPFDAKPKRLRDQGSAARYVAYVLHPRGEPAFVDLGEAEPIEAAVKKLRVVLRDTVADAKPAARDADALVMAPIRKLLGDTRRVLLSPDGDLSLIPFAALVDEGGRYLIERYSFTYLTSGRDLLRHVDRPAPRQGPLVVAAPDYGAGTPGASPGEGKRGRRAVDFASHLPVKPLPGTREEARAVAARLLRARVLLGPDATEGAVKAAQAPSILHLATHGFSYGADDEEVKRVPENALLHAGVLLAGANVLSSGGDDGVLTALEASELDLYGTKLAVLSACETGLGRASSGEGVYGLRRALSMAGAETVVMSLWDADDRATSDLMTGYYERLARGEGRSEAMRGAQRALLGRKETAHPSLWAAFIVSGDDAPIDREQVGVAPVAPGPRGCACTAPGRAGHAGAEVWLVTVGLCASALRRGRRRRCGSG